ncbi:MAG TPA: P1 family peptidase [Bacteroidota bacterium]
MITAVEGFKVGHYTDLDSLTGCTVILCPPKTRASCEVRGSSPGSRELALLAPDKKMDEINAILLTGGSAFGLAAADGVMRWLQDHDAGYQTPWGKIPLVPAAVIFDLNVGKSNVRPDSAAGIAACKNATSSRVDEGNVGAGTGATVGKWKGIEYCMKGGVGTASKTIGDLVVGSLVVVNAVGDVLDDSGKILAGARSVDGRFFGEIDANREFTRGRVLDRTNTTLAVVATNAEFSKIELFRISQRVHDGFARAVDPVHTSYDGDVSFALSWGSIRADLDFVSSVAASLTAEAIRRAVRASRSIHGIPGLAS